MRYYVWKYFYDVSIFSDSFVNSQEWTLSRSVPDLKLVSFIIRPVQIDKYYCCLY